jgi:formamidopyrimidine-DNA glycosylase
VIADVRVLDPLVVSPLAPEAFGYAVLGRRVEQVGRRGKYLLLELDAGDTLAVHLRMTGALSWRPDDPAEPERHLRARFRLDDGSTLSFSDQRRFGRAWVVPRDMPDRAGYWASRAGVEPLTPAFTARRLGALLAGRRAPLKAALLDQRLVAGIGNIYADEALFQARLHPERPAGSLDAGELRRLHRAIRDRLAAGVTAGGASIERYRDSLGQAGSMQDALRVHLHAGEPCPRCGTPIRKTRVAQRGTYWCPRCQPAC